MFEGVIPQNHAEINAEKRGNAFRRIPRKIPRNSAKKVDFLNVEEVLHYLDLKEDAMACEFGCGSADFTIALAKKLKQGRVYALDIQEEKLSALKTKLTLEKLNNVSMILCDLEAPHGSTLQNNSQDVVLIPNVLFQAENKYAMIEEAKRILKSGGSLLIIDWLKGAPFGPKDLPASATPKALQAGGIVSPDEVKKMANTLGFSLKREFAAGDYHYALLFVKE